MAHSIASGVEGDFRSTARSGTDIRSWSPGYQAYQILHLAFTIAPIIAGLDKFFHILVDWDMYLAPAIARLSPVGGHGFMSIVGVVEIVAGLLVALKPRIGGYVVALWLWGIIINLFLIPGFFDVALRDFGLSLAAVALARLASEYSVENRKTGTPGKRA